MKITDFSIHHPVIITICLVAISLFGCIGLFQMSQELFAQVSMPTLMVLTSYPGAGPEDVDREVTTVIENSISTLSDITAIRSSSHNSFSIVEIEFTYNTNIDMKIGDMREKINDVSKDLPSGVDSAPQIMRFSSSMLPVLSFSVDSPMNIEDITTYINDTLIPRISRVSGVAQANVRGNADTEVIINIRHEDAAALGIAVLDVYKLIQANNVALPAGRIVNQEQVISMKVRGEYTSLTALENQIIGATENGTFIYLRDIASVSFERQNYTEYVTRENKQIIVIDIIKQQGADTIKIVKNINTVLQDIHRETNNLISFTTINDDSYNVSLSINSVRDAAIQGAVLAIIVIFIFLHNIRSTVIIGISIPFSIFLTFCFMTLKGQGLNLMTLGGLTVSIGMIVDNSIVVLENIHRQYIILGNAKKAASVGAHEVGGSIIASTATTLVVLIPILFIEGFAGVILSDVAYTMIWAIGSSLIVAIIVVPFLSAYLLRPTLLKNNSLRSRFIHGWDTGYDRFENFYHTILTKALNNHIFVIVSAVLILILSVGAAGLLGFEFLSETDMNEVDIQINFPQTYTLIDTRNRMEEIDVYIRTLIPEIKTTAFYSGTDSSMGIMKANNVAFGRICLIPSSQRERSVFDIITFLRTALPRHFYDIDLTVENGGLGQLLNMAVGGGGFVLDVYGSNLEELYSAAQNIAAIIEDDSAVDEVSLNIDFESREMITMLNHEAMGSTGLTSYDAALVSRMMFNGMDAGVLRDDSQTYTIQIQSDLKDAAVQTSILDHIFVKSLSGTLIPLSVVSDVRIENTVNQVAKKNKMKTITIQALLNNPDLRGIQNRVMPLIEKSDMPVGIQWEISGSAASMKDTFSSLLFMMFISVFLVYMVMVIQFERFTQPLIVLASIPFAFIGIVISLTLFNTTLSIISFLGIITLAGTVVNTAIVLIDYINLLRSESYHLPLFEAVLTGSKNRLKPILMSVLTTVIGIIPMVFAIGEGSEIYAPLGQAIFGGLLTSTFITLFLIPVLYYMTERKKDQKKSRHTLQSETGVVS